MVRSNRWMMSQLKVLGLACLLNGVALDGAFGIQGEPGVASSNASGAPKDGGDLSRLREEERAFKQAAAFVEPSVVQIETFGGSDVVGGEQVAAGAGTGTIVESGWIVSSTFHFRHQPSAITVQFANGVRLPATLVASDFNRELVLLRVESDWEKVQEVTAAAVPSDRAEWRVGNWTLAIGKTFDPARASRSVGILSAMGRIFDKAIQSDAKISPYNYGGPLIDIRGKVMGILTTLSPGIVTEGEAAQWYDGGVGFAIPIEDVMRKLAAWKGGEDFHPGKLGVRPKSNDDYLEPLTLSGVTPGSPAAKAGLKAGDIVTRIDDKPILRLMDLRHALGPKDAGETIRMKVTRGGEELLVECKLVKEVPVYREPYLGLVAAPERAGGLRVGGVVADSPAAVAGIEEGQEVESIQGVRVRTWEAFGEALGFLDYREPVRLGVKQGEKFLEKVVQPKMVPREVPQELPTLGKLEVAEGARQVLRELPLGDVTNHAFAIVPRNYREGGIFGLMLVLPEAGEVTTKEWLDGWENFAETHRWIVAVISTSDSGQWSLQDLEVLQKIRTLLEKDFAIDPRRVVMGGVGSGGALAMVQAFQDRAHVRGVWTMESRIPNTGRIPSCEPKESLHVMIMGSKPEAVKFGEVITKLGYPFHLLQQKIDVTKANEGPQVSVLQRWLRWLEAY